MHSHKVKSDVIGKSINKHNYDYEYEYIQTQTTLKSIDQSNDCLLLDFHRRFCGNCEMTGFNEDKNKTREQQFKFQIRIRDRSSNNIENNQKYAI